MSAIACLRAVRTGRKDGVSLESRVDSPSGGIYVFVHCPNIVRVRQYKKVDPAAAGIPACGEARRAYERPSFLMSIAN